MGEIIVKCRNVQPNGVDSEYPLKDFDRRRIARIDFDRPNLVAGKNHIDAE